MSINNESVQATIEPQSPEIAALTRGLAVLEVLAGASGRAVRFQELLTRLGIPKATLVRLLKALHATGFVVKDEATRSYAVGPRMHLFLDRLSLTDRLRQTGEDTLRELAQDTGHTVLLIGWDGQRMQCLAKVMQEHGLAMQEVNAVHTDLSQSPWGWIFYTALSPEQQEISRTMMAETLTFTANLPTYHAFFTQQGFAYDDQQIYPHIRRLAAPLYDHRGMPVAALGLGAATTALPDEAIVPVGQCLAAASHRLAARLGLSHHP